MSGDPNKPQRGPETTTALITSALTGPEISIISEDTSTPPPPIPLLPLEQCPVCMEEVPHVPHKSNYMRLTCCGKTAHTECYQCMKAKNKSEEAKNKCALCGLTYPRRGTPKVIKRLRKWVNKGKAWAQTMLANAYEVGEGVQQSYEQARHWFELAVKQGDPMAHAGLGYLYQHGHGVQQNYDRACYLYRVAAEAEEPGAQNNLGWMYRDGLGVSQSYEKAIFWFRKSADHGDMQAHYNLGFLYYNGKGVDKSYEKALECYMAAATCGHAKSMYNVGNMFDDGHGVAQSHEMAINFWRQAASHGHINATVNIGASYQDGEGIEQNYHQAREWYMKAVMLGDEDAFDLVKQVDKKIEEEKAKLDTTHCSSCGKEAGSAVATTGTSTGEANNGGAASSRTGGLRLVVCPCKYTQYCDATCQKKHWKEHKKEHKEWMKLAAKKTNMPNMTVIKDQLEQNSKGSYDGGVYDSKEINASTTMDALVRMAKANYGPGAEGIPIKDLSAAYAAQQAAVANGSITLPFSGGTINADGSIAINVNGGNTPGAFNLDRNGQIITNGNGMGGSLSSKLNRLQRSAMKANVRQQVLSAQAAANGGNGEGSGKPPHKKNQATAHLAWWQVKTLDFNNKNKKKNSGGKTR